MCRMEERLLLLVVVVPLLLLLRSPLPATIRNKVEADREHDDDDDDVPRVVVLVLFIALSFEATRLEKNMVIGNRLIECLGKKGKEDASDVLSFYTLTASLCHYGVM